MKTKILVLVASAAIVTLSFTFVKVNNKSTNKTASHSLTQSGPVGGFASEEIVK